MPSIQLLKAPFSATVISTWDVSKPPVAKKSDRNMIKTNVLAVHHGNITAKDARLFAQVTKPSFASFFYSINISSASMWQLLSATESLLARTLDGI